METGEEVNHSGAIGCPLCGGEACASVFEPETCALCGSEDRAKKNDHMRTAYFYGTNAPREFDPGYFMPRLNVHELHDLGTQRGDVNLCSNRRNCRARAERRRKPETGGEKEESRG